MIEMNLADLIIDLSLPIESCVASSTNHLLVMWVLLGIVCSRLAKLVPLLRSDPIQLVKMSNLFILNCAIPWRRTPVDVSGLRELLDLDPNLADCPGLVIDRLFEHVDCSIFKVKRINLITCKIAREPMQLKPSIWQSSYNAKSNLSMLALSTWQQSHKVSIQIAQFVYQNKRVWSQIFVKCHVICASLSQAVCWNHEQMVQWINSCIHLQRRIGIFNRFVDVFIETQEAWRRNCSLSSCCCIRSSVTGG